MADIAKNYKYMEYGMDIWHFLETVKDCASDVCDSFADNPKYYRQAASLIERLECNEDRVTRKNMHTARLMMSPSPWDVLLRISSDKEYVFFRIIC